MAASKRAKKIRSAGEFDLVRLAAEVRAPKVAGGVYAWDLDEIRAARDMQLLGRFRLPARLAESMRTDAGLFTAWLNRLAPQRGLPVRVEAASDSARAMRIRDEAEALFGPEGIAIHPDTLSELNSQLANHGVAFGACVWTPRADGSRVDVELHAWPIAEVEWREADRCFVALLEGGKREPIVHGDGRWVVLRKHEIMPWRAEAAILPGALVWASRAYASRDWSKGSASHGNAKIVGTMPEGEAIQASDTGTLTPEAAAFLQLLRDIASQDAPVGIKPFGSTLDYITNSSQAWQVWRELLKAKDAEADRIYLGQDGTTQNTGGNYIKAERLFDVRNDIVEGDLGAITRGLFTGVLQPWCALNFGDSTLCPRRVYLLPDADEDARQTSIAARNAQFLAALVAARDAGLDVSQDYVDALSADYGVRAPKLKVANPTQPGAASPPGSQAAQPPPAPALAAVPRLR